MPLATAVHIVVGYVALVAVFVVLIMVWGDDTKLVPFRSAVGTAVGIVVVCGGAGLIVWAVISSH